MSIAEAQVIANNISLALFLVLIGAALGSMVRRVMEYRRAKEPLPVLLKALFVLFAALGVIGGESAVLRALGVNLLLFPEWRLVYTIQTSLVLLAAIAYYVKTEVFDVDDPGKR